MDADFSEFSTLHPHETTVYKSTAEYGVPFGSVRY